MQERLAMHKVLTSRCSLQEGAQDSSQALLRTDDTCQRGILCQPFSAVGHLRQSGVNMAIAVKDALPLHCSAARSTEPTAPRLAAASVFQLCPHMQPATERLDVDVCSPIKGAEAVALLDGRCAALQHRPLRCRRRLAAAITRA